MYQYNTPYLYDVENLIKELESKGFKEDEMVDLRYNRYTGNTFFEIKLYKKIVVVNFFKPQGKGPWQSIPNIKLVGTNFTDLFKKLEELS